MQQPRGNLLVRRGSSRLLRRGQAANMQQADSMLEAEQKQHW